MEPLIVNIHGASEHQGKRPSQGEDGSQQQTELIRLRREMKDAVSKEEYELASSLRDKIRKIEESAHPGSMDGSEIDDSQVDN